MRIMYILSQIQDIKKSLKEKKFGTAEQRVSNFEAMVLAEFGDLPQTTELGPRPRLKKTAA